MNEATNPSKAGSVVASTPARGEAADWLGLAIVVALGLLVYGWIASNATTVTTFTDSMDYLFLADFYRSAVQGSDIRPYTEFYRVTHFPPLFPLMLGALGAGSDQQQWATAISCLTTVAAGAMVWIWIRRVSSSVLVATAIASGSLLFPYLFVLNLTPVSEPLAMLMMGGAFAMLANQPASTSKVLVAALLIGLAPLSRSALAPLPIAFAIWLTLGKPVNGLTRAAAMLIAALPFIGWLAYRKAIGAANYDDYLTQNPPGGISVDRLEALWQRPAQLFDAAVAGWGTAANELSNAITLAIVALAVIGCCLRIGRNQLDAWFLAGYIGVVLIWPYPAEFTRFLVVVYPCVLLCCFEAIRAMTRSTGTLARRLSGFGLGAAVLVASLPAFITFSHRAAMIVDPELVGDKREPGFFLARDDDAALVAIETYARSRLLLIELHSVVPHDNCVYVMPAQLGVLYASRAVAAYPTHLLDRPEQASALLDQCDYFFLAAWSAPQFRVAPLYPLSLIEDWTEPVLISRMQRGKKSFVAAALVRRREPEQATNPVDPAR